MRTCGDAIKHVKFFTEGGPASNTVVPLGSPEIAYGGQTIAVVLANSYEVARDAAHRVVVDYEIDKPSATFESPGAVDQDARDAEQEARGPEGRRLRGGLRGGAREGRRRAIRRRRSTTTRSSCSPRTAPGTATQLTVYEPSQNVYGIKNGLAAQLGIDAEPDPRRQPVHRRRLRVQGRADASAPPSSPSRPASSAGR